MVGNLDTELIAAPSAARVGSQAARKTFPVGIVTQPTAELEPAVAIANADSTTVRPMLALAAAENLEALKASLLQAAASATKPTWITVECSDCGERSRVEAPVPDVRSRLAAIELLLHEGLGRPATTLVCSRYTNSARERPSISLREAWS